MPRGTSLVVIFRVSSLPTMVSPIAPDPASEAPVLNVAGGCGPGAWRGPWGHCRDTPYHGRLPGGGWK